MREIPLRDIQGAAAGIYDFVVRTPLVRLQLPERLADRLAGSEIFLKLETLPPIGSFMWPLLSGLVAGSIVVPLADVAAAMKLVAECCRIIAEGAAACGRRRPHRPRAWAYRRHRVGRQHRSVDLCLPYRRLRRRLPVPPERPNPAQ